MRFSRQAGRHAGRQAQAGTGARNRQVGGQAIRRAGRDRRACRHACTHACTHRYKRREINDRRTDWRARRTRVVDEETKDEAEDDADRARDGDGLGRRVADTEEEHDGLHALGVCADGRTR